MQGLSFTKDPKILLRKLTVTAVCTAFAVVLKCFTNLALNIPGLGIKIGLGGIFNFFPAALCGPIWGGAASALTDLIGHFLAPDGAYIPWLTLTAFAGGCTIGFLWRAASRRASCPLRIALLSIFSVILFFGVATGTALMRDGVTGGFFVTRAELPSRAELDAMPLSSLSRFTVGLSRYSKDSKNLTLTEIPDGAGELPAAVSVNGEERNVTAVASGALKNASGSIYIPAGYKTIPDDAFGGEKGVVIIGIKGSAAEKFASSAGFEFREANSDFFGEPRVIPSADDVSEHMQFECLGFTFAQSDNYRKNLASGINTVVLGCTLAGSCGIIFILLNIAVSAYTEKKSNGDGTAAFSFPKIALCTIVAGLLVTTVNTFILRVFVPAWADRALLVLLVPRVIEEVIVRLAQAYIISLLWTAVSRSPIFSKLG